MAYFWLNQKETDGSNYYDEIGEVYHYRENTPGYTQLSAGDEFVYYRPGECKLFGTGEIDRIEKETRNPDADSAVVEYFAHIISYQPFDPPIHLRDNPGVTDEISFLREKPGLTGVPQHSIHQISREDFETILAAAEKQTEAAELTEKQENL
ncbi:hypothetical protein AArcSl_1632 [Halalkaliarchaeum desulfuricum]|uniref:EVE domain-containing protein n=1 Tax=Halalkaliarchaeum desulfuricum TaxID=2055893 RepID=A0A343TJI9_9EURY|nr:hypothetical protein [Halalkaliarchaeum desulfuricum]AUX09261.1 hypothetical protein AArcSl_1632 [Halalkaliarchaeum desulfuricum]